jgi:glycosyltransferase involved in cell wall biosynthesis
MRILDVAPRSMLHRGGATARIGNLLRHLGERNEVRRFSQPQLAELGAPELGRDEWVDRSRVGALLVEIGERVWVTAPVLTGAALRATRPRKLGELVRWADVTVVEFPWQLGYCARLRPAGPLVLSSHNVEVEKFASYAAAAGARATRVPWLRYIERIERDAVERADLIVAVKGADRDGLVERYGADPRKIVVAPNGADLQRLTPTDPVRRAAARRAFGLGSGPVALYTGTNAPPNVRGLDWVRALADAAPKVTFLVVGTVGGRPRRERNVAFTGAIDEIGPAFDAADVSLCPVEFGGGTKLKLIESLAAGVPTVAFEESLLGLRLRDREHVLLARRSREALHEALHSVLSDPSLATRLRDAGRRYVIEHHDWRASAGRLEDALWQLVNGGRRRIGPGPTAPRPHAGPRVGRTTR